MAWNVQDIDVSASVNMINMLGRATKQFLIRKGSGRTMIYEQLNLMTSQWQTYGPTVSLAKESVLPAGKKASAKGQKIPKQMNGATFSTRLSDFCKGLPKKLNPNGCSVKMLKIFCLLTEDLASEGYSIVWEKQGTTVNGSSLIQNIPIEQEIELSEEYLKIESECTLSAILEAEVDEKYFLSEEQTAKILLNSSIVERKHIGRSIDKDIRAVLTPDRLEKRQNGRRMKEPGEEMFTLTGQDRHGVAITEVEPVKFSKKGNLKKTEVANTLIAATPKEALKNNSPITAVAVSEKDSGGGIDVLGNYSPSGHSASRVVSADGVAPTVMENHGTVTAVVVEKEQDDENL